MKRIRTIVAATLMVLAGGAITAPAHQTIRELWDNVGSGNLNGLGSGTSSIGFQPGSLWIANTNEPGNTAYMKIAQDFDRPAPTGIGLPASITQIAGNWSDNNAAADQYSSGIWAVRQLAPESAINLNVDGTNYFSFNIRNDVSPFVPVDSGNTMGGVGFADGNDASANFFGAGVTRNFYQMTDSMNIGNTAYITAGTLNQPDISTSTNSAGPCHVRAYATNKVGLVEANSATILGRIITSVGGVTTVQIRSYVVGDILDTDPEAINWDASFTFTNTGTMNHLLVWENGVYPWEQDAIRVGTTLGDVVGIEQGFVRAFPGTNVFAGGVLNLTNFANVEISQTLSYQWQHDGTNIPGAIDSFYNVASATAADAGTYVCISTPSAIWGSVTSAPLTITVSVDNVNPSIVSVKPSPDLSTLIVTYSEPVSGADTAGNYTLNGGVTVNTASASIVNNQTIVVLTTTPQAQATRYILTVNNVADAALNALSPNTNKFWSHMFAYGNVNGDWWDTPNSFSQNAYYNTFLIATPNPTPELSVQYPIWEKTDHLINNDANTFGGKMYGFFIPPVTGDYVFFCSGDDGVRLSLSTNSSPEGLCVIAAESLWSGGRCWTNFSTEFPTGAHRGDNVNFSVGPDPFNNGWAPAPVQNRSDQFIHAYSNSVNGVWFNQISFVADVVLPNSTFWPDLDVDGNAKITLQAGQQYYMQAEFWQGFGGQPCTVTYKLAGDPDPAAFSASIMTGNNIAALIPFKPTISVSNSVSGPVLTFTGILQSSTTANGPYTDVPGATSPHQPAGPTGFFRTHD